MKPPIEGASLALLTLSLSLATFMQVLDTSIANVSIPTIAGDLAVSPDQGTWVITSFAVSNAISLPLSGWLARRFGEVKLFAAATLLFTLASTLCGLSTSLPMLVVFRIFQGAVAGPMIPLSQSLLLANYPNEKKGLALSLWSMTVVLAPIFGPILGGYITDNYSWPWIFYINIPVGILATYITWQLLKERETETEKRPIDVVGLLLLVAGVGSLQLLLDKGNDLDWFDSSMIVTLAVISTVSLSFFILWEITDKHPVVDLSLFSVRNFSIGTISISLGYMTFFSGVVVYPLWLQTQMGYTATWAGLSAAPIGILSVIFSPIVGKNMHRIDLRILASFSFLVFAGITYWAASFNTGASFWQLTLPRFFQGIGMACFFIPLMSILLSGLPPGRVASASGLSNFLRVLGGSFGTSLSVALWNRRESLHHSHLTEQISLSDPVTQHTLSSLHSIGMPEMPSFALVEKMVEGQSYMLAVNDIFLASTAIFLVLMFFVWFARPPFFAGKSGGGEH
ncbi:MAG: DHA2 family efflux MFS transporter permease subunit [Burkholderiales bacterium]|nr:DHA2 family efflux MFS transporter permease subunit [Burkholderiales bacterium]